MKIEHYKTLYLLASLISVSILTVITLIIIQINNLWFFLVLLLISVVLLIWLNNIRNIKIEVNQHLISIKSWHPLWGNSRIPTLELPLGKINSYAIVGNICNKKLILNIKSKKGIKKRHYRLGFISSSKKNELNTKLKMIDKNA